MEKDMSGKDRSAKEKTLVLRLQNGAVDGLDKGAMSVAVVIKGPQGNVVALSHALVGDVLIEDHRDDKSVEVVIDNDPGKKASAEESSASGDEGGNSSEQGDGDGGGPKE